jgi:hypothetical protein
MVIKLGWKTGPAAPRDAGLVSVTRTEVARWRDVPGILWRGSGLRSGWPRLAGAVGVQVGLDLRTRTTFTVSLWTDADALRAFLRSGAHQAAVARYRDRVTVHGETWTTDRFDRAAAWARAAA